MNLREVEFGKRLAYVIPCTVKALKETVIEIEVNKDADIYKGIIKVKERYWVEEYLVLQVTKELWDKKK